MDKTKLTRLADIANEYDGTQDPLLKEFFEIVDPYLTSYYRTRVRWLGYGGTRMVDDMLSYAWSYIPRQLATSYIHMYLYIYSYVTPHHPYWTFFSTGDLCLCVLS